MLSKIKKQRIDSVKQPLIDPKSGHKLSDRIGCGQSSNNRKKKVAELSTLTVYKNNTNSDDDTGTANSRENLDQSLPDASMSDNFSPIFSSTMINGSRRSSRSRNSTKVMDPSPSDTNESDETSGNCDVFVNRTRLLFDDDGDDSTVTLFNNTEKTLQFKCRIDSDEYSVKPTRGNIKPNMDKTMRVRVGDTAPGTTMHIFYTVKDEEEKSFKILLKYDP